MASLVKDSGNSSSIINHGSSATASISNDIDQRHHKLLHNIVKILKINNVLEEYRLIVRNIQQQCCCKRTKSLWDRLNILESKYKDVIVGSSSVRSTNLSLLNNNNNNNNDDYYRVTSHILTETGDLPVNKKIKLRTPMKIIPISADGLAFSPKDSHHLNHHHHSSALDHHGSGNDGNNSNLITSYMVIDDNDDVNLIEEEEILEDEEDDDAEEELDIEEYMALSEILEKESGQNKFEKEVDPKNNLILVIRDVNTKEIICYECTVGGTCGFLSRERTRMLLHIGKHYQQSAEDEEDDEDDEDEEAVQSIKKRLHSAKDVDISIIPLKPDPISIATTTTNASLNNSDTMMLFNKTDDTVIPNSSIGGTNTKCKTSLGGVSSPTTKLFNHQQQQRLLINQQHMSNVKNQHTPQTTILASRLTMNTNANNNSSIHQSTKQHPINNNKPIKCDWDNCTFMCDQNYKLRTHIRQVHEKVRPYLCDWPGCFGAYKTRSNLASHRMVHTGERPFICDHPKCGAKFARKYDCERHRRIHSEKMYPCEWPGCGKRLCDPYNLERHMMVHKGELPFRCPIMNCIRGFRELRYLRDHMVNSHKFLPDTNQLRMACSPNSSKMISIIGYNLNEGSGMTAASANTTTGTGNDSNSAINNNNNNNNDVVATSFVAAIVTGSNTATNNSQSQQNSSASSNKSLAPEIVIKKEPKSPSIVTSTTNKKSDQPTQSQLPQRTMSTRSTKLIEVTKINDPLPENSKNDCTENNGHSDVDNNENENGKDVQGEDDEDEPSPAPPPPPPTRVSTRTPSSSSSTIHKRTMKRSRN